MSFTDYWEETLLENKYCKQLRSHGELAFKCSVLWEKKKKKTSLTAFFKGIVKAESHSKLCCPCGLTVQTITLSLSYREHSLCSYSQKDYQTVGQISYHCSGSFLLACFLWRAIWRYIPFRLQSMGLQRVRHD